MFYRNRRFKMKKILLTVMALALIGTLVYGATLTSPDGVSIATGGQAKNALLISQTTIGDGTGQRTEKLTEGAFDTSANWTFGTGWSCDASGNVDVSGTVSVGTLSQATTVMTTPPLPGEYLLVTYTISNYISGTMQVSVGGTFGTIRNAAGTYAEYLTAQAVMPFVLTPSTDASMNVDNISVIKVDGAPQNLGRMASKHDCDVKISGTVPTNVVVQVKGSKDGLTYKNMVDGTGHTITFTEKISQGTFDASTNWTFGTGWSGTTHADVSGTATVGSLAETSGNMTSVPIPGELYLVGYTISNYTSGSVTAKIGSKAGVPRSAAGKFQESIVAMDASGFQLVPTTNANMRIDNVSVIKNENNGFWIVNRAAQYLKGSYISKSAGDASTAVTLDCTSIGD